MSVFGLASAKGAPGVTTACVALTVVWPRPVLLVEADPAGGDLLAGYLAGADPAGGGLLGLALAARRAPPGGDDVLGCTLALDADGQGRVLAAPVDAAGFRPILAVADRLADAVTTAAAASDRDVLIDMGRVGGAADSPWLATLTCLLLVVEPTLRGASAARSAVTSLRGWLPDRCPLLVLLTGRGPYGPTEIAEALGVDVVGTIAHDPASARVLAGEQPAGRGFSRGPLIRSARSLTQALSLLSPVSEATVTPPGKPSTPEPISLAGTAEGRPG